MLYRKGIIHYRDAVKRKPLLSECGLFLSFLCISSDVSLSLNSFPKDKFKTRLNLKEFAENNFKFDKKMAELSKWVENTVGKGEIARHEQFLLFPQCFQKTCSADT